MCRSQIVIISKKKSVPLIRTLSYLTIRKNYLEILKRSPDFFGQHNSNVSIVFVDYFYIVQLQSWTLISTHMRNFAKKCFSANIPKVLIFGLLSSDRDNKWFFVLGLGTRFLFVLLLVSSQWPYDLQSCAKIIEKTVKNGLLSLATSNLKLF